MKFINAQFGCIVIFQDHCNFEQSLHKTVSKQGLPLLLGKQSAFFRVNAVKTVLLKDRGRFKPGGIHTLFYFWNLESEGKVAW